MKYDTIVEELRNRLQKEVSEKRLLHSEGVLDFAVRLANRYDVPEYMVKIAALAHDTFRSHSANELFVIALDMGIRPDRFESEKPKLLHGKVSAVDLKLRYPNLKNVNIIANAVRYHTSGYPFKEPVGKILFLSDSLEENRYYPGIDKLRKLAFEDLDKTFFEIVKNKIRFAVDKEGFVLPNTIKTYNSFVL